MCGLVGISVSIKCAKYMISDMVFCGVGIDIVKIRHGITFGLKREFMIFVWGDSRLDSVFFVWLELVISLSSCDFLQC